MTASRWNVIFISDPQTNGCEHLQAVREALYAGARAVVVRDKDITFEEYLNLLCSIRPLVREYEAQLFVVDNPYLVAESGADGVVLGQTDIPVAVARDILGADGYIGLSVHHCGESAEAMLSDIDFLLMGPVESAMADVQPVTERDFSWTALASRVSLYAYGPCVTREIAIKYTSRRGAGVAYMHDGSGFETIGAVIEQLCDGVARVRPADKTEDVCGCSSAEPHHSGDCCSKHRHADPDESSS